MTSAGTSEPFTLQYQISRPIYLRVYFYLYFVARWWLLLILFGCLAALTVMGWEEARQRGSFPTAMFTMIFAMMALPILAYIQATLRYRKSDRYKHPIQLTFTEDQLHSRNASYESSIPLSGIRRIVELRSAFVFWVDAGTSHLISKEGLRAEDIQALRYALAKLPCKQRLKG